MYYYLFSKKVLNFHTCIVSGEAYGQGISLITVLNCKK